jgi:hypothetical protein
VAEPIFVNLTSVLREEHEWVSRAGGLWKFIVLDVMVNGRATNGGRLALLVTDLDDSEEP